MNRLVTGCRMARGALMISHMLFDDDIFIYCKENVEEASQVLSLLRCFERASSQQVNLLKSFVFSVTILR